MLTIKYDTSHHTGATPEARIRSRAQNSGVGKDLRPDVVTQNREGWNVNIHNAAAHLRPPAGPTAGRVERHPESEVSGGDSAKIGGGRHGTDPMSRQR